MARPIKKGLLYFPLDTDIFSDKDIRMLISRHGGTGFAFYTRLLCEIYKDEGYYQKTDDDCLELLAEELKMSCNEMKLVLDFLLKRSLLDSTLFLSDKVLTSKGIQTRYQEAIKQKALKKNVVIDSRFWILSSDETQSFIKVRKFDSLSDNNESFSEINSNKSEINPTKESKVNETKIKESKITADTQNQTPSISDTDISDIITSYNSICTKLNKATELIHFSREKAIHLLLNQYGKDKILTVFKNANSSEFLTGGSKSKWKANIDWLLKQENFVKTYEGAYCDNKDSQDSTASYDIDELDTYWDTVPKLK